ncbi:glycosyltransferase family 2 protein [Sinorhizobium mexicanum]|uniref:Glycosyltransferase family 2 protein n=1 Tax=Sinorhizobium mexicanum TaxID=375549 RepID=A0A859QIY1_9HYPH|nr:glycosyltransferase [Sinorhizobium mexicanum]MBP1887303.1 glycosyltransferase involved in cell wall biosynthesis [Sinorhizobium mexicanum]QLL65812.1 glycosyltransferase family 2 protein [Sinorhizobium mexicanum]
MANKISIILPTYNRSSTLSAAINSVITQSYKDIELIVVDDGSTEDIEEVVRGIGDDRIRYVRRDLNGGAAAARNTGLRHANGDYIAFQDSDDIWLPGKLEKQLALLCSLPAYVGAVTGAKIVYGRDTNFNYGPTRIALAPPPEGRLCSDEDQLERLLTENRVSVQNTLFRNNCLPSLEWFDPCARANEDWEFAIRLVQHTIVYEDIEPVVLGFVSADSISASGRKPIIGRLRILRKNRAILSARRRQRSLIMLDVVRYFYIVGKRRSALKFLAAVIGDYPPHVKFILWALAKKLGSWFLAPSQRR